MSRTGAEERLYDLWGEIHDLEATEELLEWDQETYQPPRGHQARSQLLTTIAGLKHQRLTSPELRDALATCQDQATENSLLAAQVRRARHQVDRASHLPESLVRALAFARSAGLAAWHEARESCDFQCFEGPLAELVRLRREEASILRPDGNAYDALIDVYEPGATDSELVPLFAELRARLVPLVRQVAECGVDIDESSAIGQFPYSAQLELGVRAARAIGFDFDRGRLDPSTHPFCVGIDRDDVRMTWRWQTDDLRPALFGVLHETGHGLYEQGLPTDHWRQPAGGPVSLGIHESQSRLWENHVGRSRGFLRWLAPHYRELFPNALPLSVERLWPALHTAKPSLIRVEADEATYNLHIGVRFELERRLFDGSLEVIDLPQAWDDLYRELLGVSPADAVQGVLQDIHWAQGMFGYFPTYTLGTMAAAQLFAAAQRDLGELEEAFSRGEFLPLLDWLRRNVHQHGGRWTTQRLIEEATGKPLQSTDLLAYLETTIQEAYGF